MIKYYGAHVSCAGGLENAIKAAEFLEINSIQIHPTAPQQWNFKPFEPGIEEKYLKAKSVSQVKKVFFHAIYLINLATPDEDKRKRAMLSLRHYLDLADRVDATGVIFHVGSLKDEPDEEVGFKRAALAIDEILEKAKGKSRLILEVSAGAGRVIGAKMEDLRVIYDLCEHKERVGFGLDTQHMYASGYDFRDNQKQVIDDIGKIFGFEKVWSVHLNDSKSKLASKVDRHENLGAGEIGKDAIVSLLHDERFKEIPFVLETPAMKGLDTGKVEVDTFKEFISA